MARAAAAVSSVADSALAGADVGEQIAAALPGERPDAVVVFAAPHHDHGALLRALKKTCHPAVVLGCSSAGEFQGTRLTEGGVSALALHAPEMSFHASVGRGMSTDRGQVAAELVQGFAQNHAPQYRYRTALVLADARAGYTDDLIAQLAMHTSGTYQFVGGGAGDNAAFVCTPVFLGAEVYTDAAVALEILSNKPIGIGVSHGWEPATPPMRVTAADGLRLISLNAIPAAEVYEDHAASLGIAFDRALPVPFFLHHLLGITAPGGYQLRVPLSVDADGSIFCAAEVPVGALVQIMSPAAAGSAEAAVVAARSALRQLGENRPEVALFFDCVATRLRLGTAFSDELGALCDALEGVPMVGCNSHGQIARAEGQFSGFHNCTAVVCALPQ